MISFGLNLPTTGLNYYTSVIYEVVLKGGTVWIFYSYFRVSVSN